ncbi:helix-turn-helix domain-containing protein [Stenomitos frigidus]|uniref:Nucleotide exchange factor GrpE n=1 Tax=Stenomitos frigidus ULC18 TaxID=2107698 RepID=A0A2T1E6A7_9CYAN|nr:helix-turn-helix transcriptional regulator [Stenomitos frigidus]PSB28279.1 nucleotide exchange factor GrpE [Stenomitos frigidus ULC18]
MSQDFTHRLRELMQAVGFLSFRALSRATGISEQQIRHLRRGETANLRVDTLLRLSQTLQVSVMELLALSAQESALSAQESGGEPKSSELKTQNSKLKTQNLELKTQNSATLQELSDLRQEYDRLQQQLVQQRQTLWQEFQQASIQTLESLLLQLPTAAYAAQQNPQAPAVKLLPLLRPLDRLLEDWGIEAIAPVGAEIPYDLQYHQLMTGTAQIGEPVKVRYTGYRQGDRLLYRAKVSPIA